MRLRLLLACLLAAIVVVPGSGATNTTPSCGQVVTKNITLTKSLKNCASGLVVGADNVTINLNGYSIRGLGSDAGIGIDVSGWTGVTVKNGTITDFEQGVHLFDGSASTVKQLVVRRTDTGIWAGGTSAAQSIQILDNSVRDSRDGIFFFGAASSRIAGNTLSHLSGVGILCRQQGGGLRIEGNRSTKNNIGIQLLFCQATVSENVASDNTFAGITRLESNGSTLRNVANGNGTIGIVTTDSPGLLLGNVTNRNAGHGLFVYETFLEYGPLYTVTANTANKNGGFGIMTNLVGGNDGGGNHANHNGDPLECQGVVCT